jgi:hypothetical protein
MIALRNKATQKFLTASEATGDPTHGIAPVLYDNHDLDNLLGLADSMELELEDWELVTVELTVTVLEAESLDKVRDQVANPDE